MRAVVFLLQMKLVRLPVARALTRVNYWLPFGVHFFLLFYGAFYLAGYGL